VDELDADRSGAGADGDAPGMLWSGVAALDDELDEDIALSSAGLVASLWALEDAPDCWAITEALTPRTSRPLRTATQRDFMFAPPHQSPATAVPTTPEEWT